MLVLRDWLAFREYIDKWGYRAELVYRIDTKDDNLRVRLFGGRYGLDLVAKRDDPAYQEILDFLEVNKAKRVEDVKDVLEFFA